MKTVGDMLKQKGGYVYSVTPTDMIYDALRLMSNKKMGAVLVLDEGKLVGIVSERDYVHMTVIHNKNPRTTPVGELMTKDVLCVGPEKTAEECMFLMTKKKIRHLPVIEDKKLIGLISINDVARIVVSEQKYKIENLEKYAPGNE